MRDFTAEYVLSQEKRFEIVISEKRMLDVLQEINTNGMPHALDFETTSLRPDDGAVRITSIYGPAGFFVFDHWLCGHFRANAARIAAVSTYIVFNVGFEGRWFDDACYGEATLWDLAFMRKAKMGGGHNLSFAEQAKKDLGIELDKSEQNSRWDARLLAEEQYAYAAKDALVAYACYLKWQEELTQRQWNGFHVMNDAWRGTVEMEENGLQLDSKYHAGLVTFWERKRNVAERYLRKWTPPNVIANLNSRQQIGKFLKEQVLDEAAYQAWPKTGKTEAMELSKSVLRQASYRLPYPQSRWIAALMIFNYHNKYLSTYGQKLIDAQERFGRVKSRFNIAAAITGRYSSSAENLQNIPKQWKVRRSFVADRNFPTGREGAKFKFALCDYSSIEVRVLAEISGDKALLEEAIYGDIHAASAADMLHMDKALFKKVLDDKTHPKFAQYKTYRGRAKAITFAVCYGAGIASLAVSLRVTDEVAAENMNLWAQRYPKAYAYRQVMFEKLMSTGFIEVHDGRTIFVFKGERSLPVASNYGIQGAAASAMYRAVYHCHRLLDKSDLQSVMCVTVHDELILKCKIEEAEATRDLLAEAMRLGWLDIFPGSNTDGLADAVIGSNWGDK